MAVVVGSGPFAHPSNRDIQPNSSPGKCPPASESGDCFEMRELLALRRLTPGDAACIADTSLLVRGDNRCALEASTSAATAYEDLALFELRYLRLDYRLMTFVGAARGLGQGHARATRRLGVQARTASWVARRPTAGESRTGACLCHSGVVTEHPKHTIS